MPCLFHLNLGTLFTVTKTCQGTLQRKKTGMSTMLQNVISWQNKNCHILCPHERTKKKKCLQREIWYLLPGRYKVPTKVSKWQLGPSHSIFPDRLDSCFSVCMSAVSGKACKITLKVKGTKTNVLLEVNRRWAESQHREMRRIWSQTGMLRAVVYRMAKAAEYRMV